MNLKDWFDLAEKVEARINLYWNFYTVVVIAVAGWLISNRCSSFSVILSVTLTAVLVLFFIGNLYVISAATQRILAIEDEIAKNASSEKWASEIFSRYILNLSMANRLPRSFVLHLVIDFGVIFIIWINNTKF